MGVLKGTDRLDPPQPLLQSLDLAKDLVTGLLSWCLLLCNGELGKLALNLGGLGHVVEHAGEESTLLSGDLGSGGVVGNGAVTDSPDVLGTLDDEVLVYGETTAGVLLCGNLVDEVLDNGSESVTSSPDQKTVRDLLELLLAVRAGRLSLDEL